MAGIGAVVVEEGAGVEGMGIYLPSMKMEVGIAIEDILGAEVVGEGVVHVAVDVEDTMGPKMEVMDMKHPVKAVAVVVEGEIVEEAVDSDTMGLDLMDRSRQLHERQ